MPRVCLLTLEDRGDYVIDDALAVDELRRRGWSVDEVPWSRADVDWRAWDAVVVRTTWDYQKRLDDFLATLSRIESAGVPLANPAALIAWNARKTYLRDLADRGVPIVPTRWGHGLTRASLRALCDALGPCVVKPVVSANADNTWRLGRDPDDALLDTVARAYADGLAYMAQPFVDAVLTEGEHSVFFFLGEASHAVVKVPRAGDFRVQEEHGGDIRPTAPPDDVARAAARVMALWGARPLQARVDLVRLADGSLALMELEAIEPSLYFRAHPESAARFADALARWLDHKVSSPR